MLQPLIPKQVPSLYKDTSRCKKSTIGDADDVADDGDDDNDDEDDAADDAAADNKDDDDDDDDHHDLQQRKDVFDEYTISSQKWGG